VREGLVGLRHPVEVDLALEGAAMLVCMGATEDAEWRRSSRGSGAVNVAGEATC